MIAPAAKKRSTLGSRQRPAITLAPTPVARLCFQKSPAWISSGGTSLARRFSSPVVALYVRAVYTLTLSAEQHGDTLREHEIPWDAHRVESIEVRLEL